MKTCAVNGCSGTSLSKGLCNKHYISLRRYGDPLIAKTRRPNGAGSISNGYLRRYNVDGVQREEHILIAEKALGKPLPIGAEVHHVDENSLNNEPSNLVICPDTAYHKLLHARMRAMEACGNPSWRKCPYCHTYDSVENLKHRSDAKDGGGFFHRECHKQYMHAYRARRTAERDSL